MTCSELNEYYIHGRSWVEKHINRELSTVRSSWLIRLIYLFRAKRCENHYPYCNFHRSRNERVREGEEKWEHEDCVIHDIARNTILERNLFFSQQMTRNIVDRNSVRPKIEAYLM